MDELYITKVTEVDGVVCYHKLRELVRCKDCIYALAEGRENMYICTATNPAHYCFLTVSAHTEKRSRKKNGLKLT